LKPVYTLLLIVAILLIECLIGGTRLVFSLPSYAIVATAAVLTLASIRQPVARPSLLCLGTTAVYFAYILARAWKSPVPFLAWMDFYMVLTCLAVYLLSALYLTQTRLRTAIIVALLTLAVVEIVLGLRQFRFADDWMPFGFIRSKYGARASGTFISSITLAGYLEVMAIFALSLAIWSTWKAWARALLGYLALACYAGVAVTGSRGGYISSVFSLVVLAAITLWIRSRTNPGRFLRSAIIATVCLTFGVIAAIVLMQQSTLLQQRLDLIGKPDIRWYNWLAALDQFKVSPWFGTGAGTHLYFGRLFRRPEVQVDPEHAHSDYLELLAEYGIVGAVGMAIFLFIHLRNGFSAIGVVIKTAYDDPYQAFRDNRLAFQVGAIASVAAYLAHSVTDFNLHIPGHAMIFAFIFGIIANPVVEQPDPAASRHPGVWFFRMALPALGVWIFVSGVTKYRGDYLVEQTRIALRNRDYAETVRLGESVIAFEQRNPFVYFYLAEAHRVMGTRLPLRFLAEPHLRAAVAYYGNALRIFPQDETYWVRLAQAHDALGEFREAQTAFRTALELDPHLGVIHAMYAAHLREMGWTEGAEEQLKQSHEVEEMQAFSPLKNPLSETP
jgi:O-antigen ligase